jgi:hypothetical protein
MTSQKTIAATNSPTITDRGNGAIVIPRIANVEIIRKVGHRG